MNFKKGGWKPPLLLYLLSVSFGFLNLLSFSGFPTYYCPPPALDADFYDFLAMIVSNDDSVLWSEPYFYSPLFLWIKSLLLKFFGDSVYPQKILSLLVGSSISVALYLTSLEIFSKRIYALIVYFTSLLYGPFLFFQVQNLKTIYGIFFIAWGLYFLLLSKRYGLLAGGVAFSMAMLIYNNLLISNGLIFLYLLKRHGRQALLFLLPLSLVLSYTSYRNYSASGELVLLTATGGIHFYIGNGPKADGLYVRPEGVRPNAFGHYYDAIRVASKEFGREVSASDASKFYYQKAFNHIKENPFQWFTLFGKKTLLALNGRDFTNNENYQFYRERVPLHKHLTFSSYTIFTLGLAGLVVGAFFLRDWRYGLLFAFAISYLLSVSLFFVADRYRLPLAIPLIVSVPYLLQALGRAWRTRFSTLCLLLVSALIVFYPWRIREERDVQPIKMKYAEVLCNLKRSLREAKDDESRSRLYTEMAELYMRVAGWEQARYYYKRAFLSDRRNEYAELNYYKLGIFGVVDVEKK